MSCTMHSSISCTMYSICTYRLHLKCLTQLIPIMLLHARSYCTRCDQASYSNNTQYTQTRSCNPYTFVSPYIYTYIVHTTFITLLSYFHTFLSYMSMHLSSILYTHFTHFIMHNSCKRLLCHLWSHTYIYAFKSHNTLHILHAFAFISCNIYIYHFHADTSFYISYYKSFLFSHAYT